MDVDHQKEEEFNFKNIGGVINGKIYWSYM